MARCVISDRVVKKALSEKVVQEIKGREGKSHASALGRNASEETKIAL